MKSGDETLDLSMGHPEFLAPFWTARPDTRLYPERGDAFRYCTDGLDTLKNSIRNIHKVYGNASCENHFVVIGGGATQLIPATVYALRLKGYDSVTAPIPYFPGFRNSAQLLGLHWAGKGDGAGVIEFITYPNNPDGRFIDPSFSKSFKIYDLSYYWPHYTKIEAFEGDVMIFSLAKVTGHAACRIGWALVKDPEMAAAMHRYVLLNSMGISLESQTVASQILNMTADDPKKSCITFACKKLEDRRAQLANALKKHPEFELLSEWGLYAWIRGKGNLSNEFLKRFGVLGRPGQVFGVGDEYFRLSMGASNAIFETLLKRLENG
ncbi:MAG: aminotransferase class I/II-fold pyridoxal phosphate-dependent enzyme [Bdellovibrionia bacterium]